MTGRWSRFGALIFVAALGCGDGTGGPGQTCRVVPDPGPMTEARARVLEPALQTGLAFSLTHLRGDCRPRNPDPNQPRDPCGDGRCSRQRAARRVLVVPTNLSVPLSDRCEEHGEPDQVALLARLDVTASELGEWAGALEEGGYRPLVVDSEGCLRCAEPGSGDCVFRVVRDEITARDFVLDEAAH